ncbi:MAG: ribosomal protein L13e [Candidatus Korarchaeum sp.]|nr:ribosomal protein L13e [Candidatus Korarchaeum sp.]MDW8035385.1 ribosomal protein L13e [Candidatus Korarchaeum sp.]
MGPLSPLVLTSMREPKRKKVGRGFSLRELERAEISVSEAKKLGIYIDRKRKTVHGWNVEALIRLKMTKSFSEAS